MTSVRRTHSQSTQQQGLSKLTSREQLTMRVRRLWLKRLALSGCAAAALSGPAAAQTRGAGPGPSVVHKALDTTASTSRERQRGLSRGVLAQTGLVAQWAYNTWRNRDT